MTSPSLKFSAAVCLCFAAALSAGARRKQDEMLSKRERRQKQYPELVRTFDLAEAAPAPLRALALLRIAAFPTNKDEEWKRELLEEAFDAASQSPLRWQVSYVGGPEGPMPGPLPRRFIEASEINNSGLDRLSLQTAIVLSMMALDQKESVKLFNGISPLGLSALTCSDGLVPNVEAYYQTASQLANDAFTLQQRKKKEHVEFLRILVSSMTSPVEVGPAAQMLWELHLPPGEGSVLAAAFGQQLAEVSADDRSFFSWFGDTSESVLRFADSLTGGDAAALLKAWRAYLVRNLNGVRCAETVDPKWYYPKEASTAVREFNRRADHVESVTRIEEADIHPEKVEPSSLEKHGEVSEQSQEFHMKWERLMFGDQHVGLTDEQKDTAEWRSQFEETIESIENVKASGDESDADLLRKKCDLMRAAALVAPSGAAREHVLARYAALLKVSNIQPEELPEWYSAVHSLIDFTQSVYKDRQSVLKSLDATGDPLLSLVAAIHRLETAEQKPASSSANQVGLGLLEDFGGLDFASGEIGDELGVGG